MLQIAYCIGLFFIGFLMGRNYIIRIVGFIIFGIVLLTPFLFADLNFQHFFRNLIDLNLLISYVSGFILGVYFRYLINTNLRDA